MADWRATFGYPVWAAMLSSALMWAGPAQVLLFGSIATGTALPVVAVAVLFSSLRFMPMTISLVPLINDPKRPLWQLLLAAHLVSITNWVEGMRRLPHEPKVFAVSLFLRLWFMSFCRAQWPPEPAISSSERCRACWPRPLLFTTRDVFSLNLAGGILRWTDALPIMLALVLTPIATALVAVTMTLSQRGSWVVPSPMGSNALYA